MKYPVKPAAIVLLAAIGMLVLSACAAPAVAANGSPADQPHTISVTGSGSAYAAPDTATAQIGVQTRDVDPAKAVSANTDKMTALIAALKAQGIEEKDIQTSNFSVQAQQDYDPQTGQPKGTITYVVDNTVNVTVRDLTKVGTVLSAAVDAGANNIYGVSFSVADQAALEAQARDKAMADARARAEQLAKAAGVTLDTPLSISESIMGGPIPFAYARNAAADMAQAAPVPVQGGQIQVQIQVSVSYIIK